ncbi:MULTISPECIES: oxygen-insensitive NADPH nitroreductase [Virgibacillus]|uniref:FMN reductase (NADPH) n=1 Tax=Virgibacillus massiliensis TaxID=1462526 RepID=A0A024QCQ9_9BACI|nr:MULTISPECIES: oxygen-insensitive NADPH nitroreductase [Virgibacillus]EQB36597.1 hypothetical protein M948_16320 [Virgibacillus sp. CM-4]CDQ40294.1 FMN reductase (NADPH) [Virgibacillus massiliensis]
MMTYKAIETILNHRSIRKFKNQKLTVEQVETIIEAAQYASTSSYVMAYTIIGITDEKLKEELAAVSGQPYVKDNGHLFVFCGDLHRSEQLGTSEQQNAMQESLETSEQFIVATVDAALAAQNAATAAEDLGLGICFLGSLRNDINRVNELLQLPDKVIPLFGLAVGYPDHQPEQKPRLPLEVVYHQNFYQPFEKQLPLIQEFDENLKSYYAKRTSNKRVDTWTAQITRKFSNPIRLDVTPFLKMKNMNKK